MRILDLVQLNYKRYLNADCRFLLLHVREMNPDLILHFFPYVKSYCLIPQTMNAISSANFSVFLYLQNILSIRNSSNYLDEIYQIDLRQSHYGETS